MKTVEFNNLIELVSFDQNIMKLEHAVAQLVKEQHSLQVQLDQLHSATTTKKDLLHTVKKNVDAQELLMRTLDEEEASCRAKMNSVTATREINALQKEMNIILEKKNKIEKDLIQAWNKTEQAAKDMTQLEETTHDQVTTLQAALEQAQSAIAASRQELESIATQRQSKLAGIPAQWLQSYQTMRGRVMNPIVPVVNQSCQGCFYYVTPQDMQQLLHKKMLQCKDCYRLIYAASLVE